MLGAFVSRPRFPVGALETFIKHSSASQVLGEFLAFLNVRNLSTIWRHLKVNYLTPSQQITFTVGGNELIAFSDVCM